jgi:CRP-like cAMP-binding protein
MTSEHPLEKLHARLAALVPLRSADRSEILNLPHVLRSVGPHDYVVHEGAIAEHSCLIQSGYLMRHKIVANGARQIVSVHMAGDMANLQNSLLKRADHSVQALTDAELVMIPGSSILALAAARPAVAMAMWLDTLIDGAIFREWIANVGRRDGLSRTAHILCEFAIRQEAVGLSKRGKYDLPLTQEQLADAVGLTPVHVNRTLKALERAGLIERERRSVTIANWDALSKAGDFDPSYLYLDLGREAASGRPA